jgi:hypothetical protein
MPACSIVGQKEANPFVRQPLGGDDKLIMTTVNHGA